MIEIDGRPLTWRCHVCGEERPDEKISVHSAKRPGRFEPQANVRYCNDRSKCAEGAHALAGKWLSSFAPKIPNA